MDRKAASGVRGTGHSYASIWAVVKRIPRGKVATYGQVAALAGRPGQPRLAGYAMRHVPEGSGIPWHRVINARGEVSPRASGPIEMGMQRALLESEGVRFDAEGRVDLSRYQWRPRGPVRAGSRRPEAEARPLRPRDPGSVKTSGRNRR